MDKPQDAVGSVIDNVKKVTLGEKKPKVKKQKGGEGGGEDLACIFRVSISLRNQC
jgi:threonyl-tRNA synthetase